MSKFNRKGFTTIQAKNGRGDIQHVAVPTNGKLARATRLRNQQMERQRKQHIKEYKKTLRAAKKRFPIEERAHLTIADL
jgi:hypothetical protein